MGWKVPLGLVEQSLAGLEPLGGAWRERGPTLTFLRASQHYTGVGHMVEGPILSGGSSRLERLVLLFETR